LCSIIHARIFKTVSADERFELTQKYYWNTLRQQNTSDHRKQLKTQWEQELCKVIGHMLHLFNIK